RSVSHSTLAPNTVTLLPAEGSRPVAVSGSTASSSAGQRAGSVAALSPRQADPDAAARSLVFAVPEASLSVENLAPPRNLVLSDLQLEQVSQAVCGVLS